MKSKSTTRLPSLCLHKPTGQAYVRLKGQMMYLGRHDKPKSRIRYMYIFSEFETFSRLS